MKLEQRKFLLARLSSAERQQYARVGRKFRKAMPQEIRAAKRLVKKWEDKNQRECSRAEEQIRLQALDVRTDILFWDDETALESLKWFERQGRKRGKK